MYSFIWSIDNFSSYLKKDAKILNSCPFYDDTPDKSQWCLYLQPNKSIDQKMVVSCSIKLLSIEKSVDIKFRFVLLGNQLNVITRESKELVTFKKDSNWSFNLIEHSKLLKNPSRYLPAGKLTIRCELLFANECLKKLVIPKCPVSDDLTKLYNSKMECDVIFWVGNNQFPAHKAILSSRCAVFASMFEHEMLEKIENKVVITDIESSVFQLMLKCIYSGKPPSNPSLHDRLLVAADKYGLDRLKLFCEQSLISRLSIDTVVELLILAEMCHAKHLKIRAIDFINSEPLRIINSKYWDMLVKNCPTVVADLFSEVTKKPTYQAQTWFKFNFDSIKNTNNEQKSVLSYA